MSDIIRKKILISNDDGIDSEGSKVLAERFSLSNEVMVVAPASNRSACSHSLSIGSFLKLEKETGYPCSAYSLSGTPADCVKFAKLVFPEFDFGVVVAGINKGHNLGTDIFYSGTVSIACEAAFFGSVAFAFSVFSHDETDFSFYADKAKEIVDMLLPLSEKGDIWNVNFPEKRGDIKGIKITPLGKQLYSDEYVRVGNDEFMFKGQLLDHSENPEDCDVEWIKKGYVTVTPIVFDKTDYKRLDEVKKKCKKLL